jgi:hypothetical protein
MRAKYVVTLVLAAFVLVALATVGRDALAPASQTTPDVTLAAAMPVAQAPEPEQAPLVPTAAVEEAHAVPSPAAEEVSAAVEPPVKPALAPVVVAKAEPPKPLAIPAARTPARRIVATYFHGNVRCTTCRKVESYAREAVEEGFATEIEAGTVEFRTVNVEEPQNRHFVRDYQLMTRSVVVTEEVDGVVEQWTRLDQVWSFVGHRPTYLNYVQDAVRGYLELQ